VSLVHIRDLAKFGVIADRDPYDLPPEAFSAGVNVRFRNGRVIGAPVFRNVYTLGTADPRYVFSATQSDSSALVFLAYENGRVFKYSAGAETDYSIASYSSSVTDGIPWSDTELANVLYVNRPDRTPWYLRSTDTQFQNLASSGWDSTWRAQLLRTCAGALVALNVTKGATVYPTMVKTSSIPTSGSVPASWDQTIPSTLATENILAEMEGPIVDGCKLGQNLIIYGLNEAWLMSADNSSQVYRYEKLPFKKGAINANCSVEYDGKNYVFGQNDIWVHDGTSERSLVDERVREFIFTGLNLSRASRCFVKYNAPQKEIVFAYVSGDRLTNFINNPDGCNRQAVFNLVNETWTFDDLPFVFSACSANLSQALTYSTVTTTYDTAGGTYLDLEDGLKRTLVYVGSAHSDYSLAQSLYAFDLFGAGSTVTYAVDTHATGPRYLERDGIDLDELNTDLRGYKTLSSLYPQARLGLGASPLLIAAGASDYFGGTATFTDYQSYDGGSNYKLDFNVAGRWLSLRIKFADYRELSISGFDLDLHVTGNR
jgi:hypothetical protein